MRAFAACAQVVTVVSAAESVILFAVVAMRKVIYQGSRLVLYVRTVE